MEKLAQAYLDYGAQVRAIFEQHSDEELRVFVGDLPREYEPEAIDLRHRHMAQVELGLRYHIARAIELKADCYCVFHAMDMKDCGHLH